MRRRLAVLILLLGGLAALTVEARQATPAGPPERVRAQPYFSDDALAPVMVPAGTRMDVSLLRDLDSATAKIDDKFDATTTADCVIDGRVVIPAVTHVHGFVSSVRAASPANRAGSITLSFDQIVSATAAVRFRASVEQVFNGHPEDAAKRMDSDPTITAALTRTPGTPQELLIGVRVDSGGSLASTQATDVRLPAGTVLRIRLDLPLTIGAGR